MRKCDRIINLIQDYLCISRDNKPYINNIGEVKQGIN